MVPTPACDQGGAGKMGRKASLMALTPANDLGPATGLVCRECGSTRDLGPFYACEECFGPREIAYDVQGVTRPSIESGPRNTARYRGLLAAPSTEAVPPNT